ncbi:enolase C-terminal domain-like protein [Diaminobutyricibacter sp. McL0618]|uniref:enolase C-terminal domain-like protein n=1 Tax=Leifsonia sp. McL0618 TaxID=3415677 RepID=UPI003CE72963
MPAEARIVSAELGAYTVPTRTRGEERPESDGTLTWDKTSLVVVQVTAGSHTGLGYAYTSPAAFAVARDVLVPLVLGSDPLDSTQSFWRMADAVRNLGWPGVCAGAISAVDCAVNDLKARMLGISLTQLLGGARPSVTAYGSGGFTNYTLAELQGQLHGWAEEGLTAVKIKVGADPAADLARVAAARAAVGDAVELFVDANGAYERKQALRFAEQFADLGVTWFEEPVSSDDLSGLRLLRDRAPAGMRIAAGEYGYTPSYFHEMLAAGAVDVIQADATRCGGPTGFLLAAAQATGAHVPASSHTAPAIHASLDAALPNVVNAEYFHDHILIEDVFFDGLPALVNGELVPDRAAPGHGMTLKREDAHQYLTEAWASANSQGD